MIHDEVALFDHRIVPAEVVTHSCTLVPGQTMDEPVIETVGFGKIVIDCDDDEVHPLASVPVAIYVPVDVGAIHCVVSPLDQE